MKGCSDDVPLQLNKYEKIVAKDLPFFFCAIPLRRYVLQILHSLISYCHIVTVVTDLTEDDRRWPMWPLWPLWVGIVENCRLFFGIVLCSDCLGALTLPCRTGPKDAATYRSQSQILVPMVCSLGPLNLRDLESLSLASSPEKESRGM